MVAPNPRSDRGESSPLGGMLSLHPESDSRRDQPVKIPVQQFRTIQRLATRCGVPQREFVRRTVELLESVESRFDGECPLRLLELLVIGKK